MEVTVEKRILAYIEAGKPEKIVEIISKHIETHPDQNIGWSNEDDFGQPLIFRIIETCDSEIVQAVMNNVDQAQIGQLRDENNCSALHFAVLSGKMETVKMIARDWPELLLATDAIGCTPLHWASKHGFTSMLEYLCTPDTTNQTDTSALWSPLHYAASSNKLETAKWLLSHGADASKKDAHGRTASDIAAQHAFIDLESFLKSKADEQK